MRQSFKKIALTSTVLFGSVTLSHAAMPVLVPESMTNIAHQAQLIQKSAYLIQLQALKRAIDKLVIFKIKDSGIGGYKELETNAGTIFLDGSGDVLLSGQSVVLINYSNLKTDNFDNIKKVIEDSTNTHIEKSNKDHGLIYFKAGDLTIITDKDITKSPIAILGAFTNIKNLLNLSMKADKLAMENNKNHQISQKSQNNQANKEAPKTIENQNQTQQEKVMNALNYITHNYQQNIIHFKAKSPIKGTLTVFTDYTCPHCQELHQHLGNLLNQGFDVNYIMMPRAGINSEVAQNMQKAICSTNPVSATEYLYAHQSLPNNLKENKSCQADIKDNLGFATGFSITGTPTVIASNGNIASGFSTVYGLLAKLKLV